MDKALDLGAVHDACRARWVSAVLEERQLALPLEGVAVRPAAAAVPYEQAREVRQLTERTVRGPDARTRMVGGKWIRG